MANSSFAPWNFLKIFFQRFSIWGWLTPPMQSPQIGRADSLYKEMVFQTQEKTAAKPLKQKQSSRKANIKTFKICIESMFFFFSSEIQNPYHHIGPLIFSPVCSSCHQLHLHVSQVALVVKKPSANAGDVRDTGWIPGSGRSPGGGHGNPLQYSCLENTMDRGAWWARVHRVAESDTTEATLAHVKKTLQTKV